MDSDNPKVVSESLTEGHCLSGTSTTLLGMGMEGNPWEWICQGDTGGSSEVGYAILEVVDDPEDYCQETAETATNGGYGWNPIQEISCVPESQNFCHETVQTATNGGWGWNPYTEAGCEFESDNGNNSEPECIDEDGDGWGWNGTESCQVEPTVSQDYCHETAQTATNGGWGWNPVTEQGCLVEDSNTGDTHNLVQNSDFSNGWDNWTDATWQVTSTIDIFDERAVITLIDNPNGGDAKLFHNEIAVTAGNYTFGATITNDVEVTAMLYLKKADGSDKWSWAGVIPPSATEQTVTFNKTISADVITARVIMSIKDIGTLGIDDYFLIKE